MSKKIVIWPTVDMLDFQQKAPFESLEKRLKAASKISVIFLPNDNDINLYSCVLSCWEGGILLNKLFIPGGRLVHPSERILCAEVSSSHSWNIIVSRRYARDFKALFKVSRRDVLE